MFNFQLDMTGKFWNVKNTTLVKFGNKKVW